MFVRIREREYAACGIDEHNDVVMMSRSDGGQLSKP